MTADTLQRRIDAYCERHNVPKRGGLALPPYPAGERETPQHREWIVLYKAIERFRRRQRAVPASAERVAALAAQDSRCPVCLSPVGADAEVATPPQPGSSMTVVHAECSQVLAFVLKAGPEVLVRLRSYLWPERQPSRGKAR